jgi:hypothetical protein
MVSVQDETETKFPGAQKPISLLSWAKRRDDKSVTHAIWEDHVGAVLRFTVKKQIPINRGHR